MRLLLTVALSLVSLSLSAGFDLSRNLTDKMISSGDQTSSIVVEKSQASGITFVSNAEHYQLIAGGRAVKPGADTSGMVASMAQRQGQDQGQLLWQGSKGPFDLSIIDQQDSQQISRAQANTGSRHNDKQIAYNLRTRGIAIITGKIVVSYTADHDAQFIAKHFNIQLADDFPHLKTAFYSVNPGQDIFLITDSINQSSLVSKAEVEVIENFHVPY